MRNAILLTAICAGLCVGVAAGQTNYWSGGSDGAIYYNGGDVGIGTATPAFRLEVSDSGSAGLRVETLSGGGQVASFGGNGDFAIDAPGVVGGRFVVKSAGNIYGT
jgi:hypothetical protein